VAKRVWADSNEEKILRQLSTTACCLRKHIIELIGVADTGLETGRWIVLPERQPVVDQLFKGSPLHGRFVQLSRDLAKGVTFLHDNNIAHLDIKPANLVYTLDFQLQIIDFDTSIWVKNEDEKISGRVGSEGYMAPEMGPENGIDGQHPYYSPIRADRYSCGVVMKEFAKLHEGDDEGLMDFANKLIGSCPHERPRLSEWYESAAEMNVAPDSLMHSESETLVGEETEVL
jgi:serine/threonine protein kinase